ncbi:MAG: hypothetical protein KGM43_11975 [Planctomycetota bacterium]|nr:hypothetical protein [Planctomycetota bacterium]
MDAQPLKSNPATHGPDPARNHHRAQPDEPAIEGTSVATTAERSTTVGWVSRAADQNFRAMMFGWPQR